MRGLFGRSGREDFAFAPWLRFWLGLGRLLSFFFAFIFASHGSQDDTNHWPAERVCRPMVPFGSPSVRWCAGQGPRQVIVIQDGVEDERVGADGFAAIDGIVGEEKHIAFTEMGIDDDCVFGD